MDQDLSDRIAKLEQSVGRKASRSFWSAVVLALIPIGFGLYQVHLANVQRAAETQTGALIAALDGSPSEICGNLSLLVRAQVLEGERQLAATALIDQIRGVNELDGGLEIDCFPTIQGQSVDQPVPAEPKSVAAVSEFPAVELKYTQDHDPETVAAIGAFLNGEGIAFIDTEVTASAAEIAAYSGLVWYYDRQDQPAVQTIVQGLGDLGIDMEGTYYTRAGLSKDLPIRIWVPKADP